MYRHGIWEVSRVLWGTLSLEGQRRLQHELEEHTDYGGDTMDNKKEMERAELHRAIWQIANDLRGSVDDWDFKQYVLGTLFYRYISEKLTNYLNREAHEAGDAAFDYAALSDEEAEMERENLVAHGHGQGAGEQSVRQKHNEIDTFPRVWKRLEITDTW